MSIWFKVGDAIALLFLAGALIMSYFLILSGARRGGVLKNFYWIEANTAGFNDASNTTRWYNYDFCGWERGNVVNCSHKAPAKPFSPRDNFGYNSIMPSSFLNHRDQYYYLSRVGWAMLLIAVFYESIGLFIHIWNLFKYYRVTSIINTTFHWLALFFITLAACLLTACHSKATRAFHSKNRHAKMGAKNFAFLWTTVFLLLMTSIWGIISTVLNKREQRNSTSYYSTTTATTTGPVHPDVVDDDLEDEELGYGNTTDSNTGKTDEGNTSGEYNVVEPAQTSQLPKNPDIVASGNQDTTKKTLFNKIRGNHHDLFVGSAANHNETPLTSTKEEDETV